jgi:hypothetical protein
MGIIRNSRAVVAVSALSAVALIAGAWTLGGGGSGGNGSDLAVATWTPGGQLPGVPVALGRRSSRAEAALQTATKFSPGIDKASLREAVAGGGVGSRMRLITARGPGGAPCVSFVTDSGAARQFSCLDSTAGDSPLLRFVGDGGTTLGVVEWVSLVGLARSDVARVTLVAQDGSERELALNSSRGFAYSTSYRPEFPASLRAYDATGSLIAEVPTYP